MRRRLALTTRASFQAGSRRGAPYADIALYLAEGDAYPSAEDALGAPYHEALAMVQQLNRRNEDKRKELERQRHKLRARHGRR